MRTAQKFFGIILIAFLLASCSSDNNSGIGNDDFNGKWVYSGPSDGSIENYFIFNGNIVFNKWTSREGVWSGVARIRLTNTEIVSLEGAMRETNLFRNDGRAYPYRFEDGQLFLIFSDYTGSYEYRFTKQSNDSFSGSANSYDDFTGKWVDLLAVNIGSSQERYFELVGDNLLFRGLEAGWDQTWNGKFTFTDTRITFTPDEVSSWDGGTTGTMVEWLYWLDGNILTLGTTRSNTTYLYGAYTKQ